VDWPTHKKQCGKPTPTVKTVTALLFPQDEDAPRFIKVEYTERLDDEDGNPLGDNIMQQSLDTTPWIPRDDWKHYYIYRLGHNGPSLGRTLSIVFNDGFLVDGSKVNRSIQKAVPGGPPHPWGGNILILRSVEPLTYLTQYEDATMNDVAPAVMYFHDYARNSK